MNFKFFQLHSLANNDTAAVIKRVIIKITILVSFYKQVY